MKQFFFIIVLSMFSLSFNTPHPIYISMADIDYKSKDKRLEIAIKIFSDDLEKAINMEEKELVEIATDREHKDATVYIQQYLKENFKLYNNQKELEWDYVGRELDRDEAFTLWVYIKVDKVKKLQSFQLYNNILISYREEQRNKISFRVDKNDYQKYDTYKDNEMVTLHP